MYTFLQLKTETRQRIWPSGQSDRLESAHDKMFVDAMMDLQTWAKCLQQDHTDVVPQCATFYNCGLTVFGAPRGRILKVSVIDKIAPETGLESADAADDYCAEIVYRQVDPCHIRHYLSRSQQRGCCLSIPYFFGLSYGACGNRAYPAPTDAGLPDGLPLLPLGYHYPQTSTDRTRGRSRTGVWAIERGKLYIAPWIQSTESVLVKWDGLKRTWADQDAVDPDPQLSSAVEEFVRWQHASKYDRDDNEMMRASGAYNLARQTLIHECREETRIRSCEASQARGASLGFGTLFYNDEQSATVSCPAGKTGSPVTVTIPAGTVGSNKSVADANQTAQEQAQEQAQAQLVCADIPATYTNNVPGQYTATCAGIATDPNAPTPTGNSVTVPIPVGTVTGASQDEANSNAQQRAEQEALKELVCVFANSQQQYTAQCAANPLISTITKTVPAGTYTAPDQNTANQLALSDAQDQALGAMATAGCGDVGPGGPFYNTARGPIQVQSTIQSGSKACTLTVIANMPAGQITGASQGEANGKADQTLQQWANTVLGRYVSYSNSHAGGTCFPAIYSVTYPDYPYPPTP
jgi:hypothetical protein